MTENGLMTMKAVAADYGVSPVTISDLVITHCLTPKPMSNGKAKGLDASDRKILAKALNRSSRRQLATAG